MSRYEVLTIAKGAKYMPKVWNFFFESIDNGEFFVTPWAKKATEVADCAEFRLSGSTPEILFFVLDEELARFLSSTHEQLYLFGAYNQVNVCQMRAKGTVTLEEAHPETEAIRERLRSKISARVGACVSKLSEQEAEKRFEILDRGKLFCFYPIEYAYAMYERG